MYVHKIENKRLHFKNPLFELIEGFDVRNLKCNRHLKALDRWQICYSDLGTGTPEQVADNVRYLMSALAPNSGFVFNQVHNIMGNVKPENIVAMLDTAYEESFKYGTLW